MRYVKGLTRRVHALYCTCIDTCALRSAPGAALLTSRQANTGDAASAFSAGYSTRSSRTVVQRWFLHPSNPNSTGT
jgi:hypothetical protein